MLQGRQIERLVSKVIRLNEVYQQFLIEKEIAPTVSFTDDSGTRVIQSGQLWGKDFQCGTFSFTASGLQSGQKYYLYAETGGVEHQIFVNGKRVGMIDYVENALDPAARTHKYVLLENLQNGDNVQLEAYYSHPFPGTMPFEELTTFALNKLSPNRPYKKIVLVVLYEQLKEFCEKLQSLNRYYNAQHDAYAKAQVEKVYVSLFELLSQKQQRPQEEALQKAVETIDNFFDNKDNLAPYVGIIGHSHLDTAWLWTTDETRRKLLRTLSNAVTLLKRYPEYKFFMSTVLYLKWLEETDANLFAEVSDLIRQGRLEPNGAAWVECDCNLTGAEALCRQFLRGKSYLREKFNYESDTFWLPDTFGYSAALPQILKDCDIKYFLTTKLSWNDTNRFPYDTFLWRGLDGSVVPVHFTTIHSGADFQDIQVRLDNYRDKHSNCVLMAYGFGDGGGGPADEMVKRAIHTEKHFTAAKVRHTTVSDFMQRVAQQQLPTYFGELYLELHRGTYTTNHQLKQNNRRLEEALHNAELVSVFDNDAQAKTLTDSLYDVLLLNQFHDILPGTCIAEATDMAIEQQACALNQAREYICGSGAKQYYNTLGFARSEILPAENGQSYMDLDGNVKTVATYNFDAYGYGKQISKQGVPFVVDGCNITTPQLSVKLEKGVITSLVYGGRQLVGKHGFNQVRCAEDVPYIYDNWDIDADYVLKERGTQFVSQQVITIGENLLVVRVQYKISEKSLLTTDIKFRADSPLVEFENKLSFYDTHTLLRTYFDTTLFASHYNCETQFGHVERNCYPSNTSDIAKFEVCAHKWTDLSERNCGLSLLSDSKYGVSCDGGKLGLTLHKSGTHPDSRGDAGESYFRYAILPHSGALGMETITQGYCFNNQPVQTCRRNLCAPFVLSDGSVVVETVKHGEREGIVLRMCESLGSTANVTLDALGKDIVLTNILEDQKQSVGKIANLTFSPFEIKTVLLK